MKAVIQRVKSAAVDIENSTVAKIQGGLLILLGVEHSDTEKECDYMVDKITAMRIFSDENGKFNYSIKDIDGEMLVVSQFTLLADTRKGNRPSFTQAAHPDIAKPMYELFCQKAQSVLQKEVKCGVFGADMLVSLENDGPVTIMLDSSQSNR